MKRRGFAMLSICHSCPASLAAVKIVTAALTHEPLAPHFELSMSRKDTAHYALPRLSLSTIDHPKIMATTNAYPPGGTFLDTLKKSFTDVPIDKEKDNAISTTEFLEAAESLTTLFGINLLPLLLLI